MQKTLLLATKNHDKFAIVKELLKEAGFGNYALENLYTIGMSDVDVVEMGDILERAKQKAQHVYELLNEKTNNFSAIIGIDDGMLIRGHLDPNVKKIMKPIIDGEVLKEGEIVYNCRAFYFLTGERGGDGVVSKIPFKYKKPSNPVLIKENSYPLSYVFTNINDGRFIGDCSQEEQHSYYSEYITKDLFILGKKVGLL